MLDVTQAAEHVLQDPASHANHVPLLLGTLTAATDEDSIKLVIRALKLFFAASTDFGSLTKRQRTTSADGSAEGVGAWLHRQYTAYKAAMLKLLQRKMPASVQAAAVSALMEAARTEQTGHLSVGVFRQLFRTLMTCPTVQSEVLALLMTKWLGLADVRYHALRCATDIAAAHAGGQAGRAEGDGGTSSAEDEEAGLSTGGVGSLPAADVARNLYDVLCNIPVSTPDSVAEMASWCGAAEEGLVTAAADAQESMKARKRRRQQQQDAPSAGPSSTALDAVAWANPKAQKRAFSTAWVALLRLSLPDDVLRKALARLASVLPHLTSPLLLADLLSGALDRGGLCAMLALNGLFLLVTQHGLEYPAFYQRLYCLLTPATFLMKQRSRFFQLADIFLASGLVPAYTAAAFAKRFARLALTAPPGGAMLAVAFVHNLLRRHPACTVLLHRPLPPGSEGVGQDPYKEDEADPAKSCAVESSLWELAALRVHACPQVSAFAGILDKNLTEKRATAEADLEPLLAASASSLISEELAKKLKGAATAFYDAPPSHVLALADLPEFAGWQLVAPGEC